MNVITIRAPAKINWTLEVLGRRTDGYHEILSVAQTIGLWDELRLEPAADLQLHLSGLPLSGADQGEGNLVLRAARLLQAEAGSKGGAHIYLHKGIPLAAGLGGGSSDAAAALRGLNRLWDLGLDLQALHDLATRLGSDVPFFLVGGTALLSGRGERVTPLPDIPARTLVVAVPPGRVRDKTARAYEHLHPVHYTDGSRTRCFIARARSSRFWGADNLMNCFDDLLPDLYPALEPVWTQCRQSGFAPHLAGSGPGFFFNTDSEMEAERIAGDLRAWGLEPFIICTIDARTAIGEH